MPSLSVLICTYNRPALLAHCLDALLLRTQMLPDQVVVVNGGDGQTDEIVQSYQNRTATEVRLTRTKNVNLATSRNVGLPECNGDIIALTDDDAEVFPDWVTQHKRIHVERAQSGAIGGPVFGDDTRSLAGRTAERIAFPYYPAARSVRTLPGVNVSYKREVVERVGPQDVTLFRGEDVDYNWRVQQLGYDIYYDPAVRVRHHHRPTLRGLVRQQYMYGRAYYLVRRKWPEMYCVYPHRLRGMRDVLKAINFGAAVLYEPLLGGGRAGTPAERVLLYPLLVAIQLAWRGGMMRQRLRGQSA